MNGWSEKDSSDFVTYGDLFVPNRSLHFKIFNAILSSVKPLQHVVDLSCGEGLLAHHILSHFDECRVGGYDLSDVMLKTSREKNQSFGKRFYTRQFDMTKSDWREAMDPVDAAVSSLAIHHLDDQEKQGLFRDMYNKINGGGVFAILDIINPANSSGLGIAREMWDEDVRTRAIASGKPEAFQRFKDEHWNYFANPDLDPIDKPSTLLDQLKWLEAAGFRQVDVFWMYAGHALFAGWK